MSSKSPLFSNATQFLVVGLIIGAFGGYFIITRFMSDKMLEQETQINSLTSTISNLNSQIIEVETENEEIHSKIAILQEEKSALESEISDLENKYEEMQDFLENYEEINQSYMRLLYTLNMTVLQSFTQVIDYNISAGTERTWEFLIPKYGVIWEAKISFSGDYVSMSHAWRRGEERIFVGSSGVSLTYKGSEDIVYYGIQEHLWGTITVDYYLDERDSNKLWVMGSIMTNLPTINRGGHAYIDIS